MDTDSCYSGFYFMIGLNIGDSFFNIVTDVCITQGWLLMNLHIVGHFVSQMHIRTGFRINKAEVNLA